jgi:hypothetical protein
MNGKKTKDGKYDAWTSAPIRESTRTLLKSKMHNYRLDSIDATILELNRRAELYNKNNKKTATVENVEG